MFRQETAYLRGTTDLQIGPVVSEHGLGSYGFRWFWSELVHLVWTNQNKIQNGNVFEQGLSTGVDFIKIGSVVSEHELGSYGFRWFWTDLVHLVWTNPNKIQNGTVLRKAH